MHVLDGPQCNPRLDPVVSGQREDATRQNPRDNKKCKHVPF